MRTKEDLIELADEELDEAIEACYLGKFATLQDNVLRTERAFTDARTELAEFKMRDPHNIYVESLEENQFYLNGLSL